MAKIALGKYEFDYQGSIGEQGSLQALQTYGMLEPDLTLFLHHIMPNNDCIFFDVGSNIGWFSIYVNFLSHGKTPVIAFEPAEDNCQKILHNIDHNTLQDMITLHQAAVGANNGMMDFYFSNVTDHAHSFYDHTAIYTKNGETEAVKKQVNVMMLDNFTANITDNQTVIIKIDTEGAEHDVITGAKNILQRNADTWVVCELHPYGLRAMNSSVQQLRDAMLELGFDTFALQYDVVQKTCSMPVWIPPHVAIQQKYVTNILFAKQSQIAKYWKTYQL